MKSELPKKGSRTISGGLRDKKASGYPPYEEVDLDALIAELVSQSDEARDAYEEDVTITDLVLDIILLREKAGLSQKELAEKLGVSQQMVSKMENSNYDGRTISKIWRHVNALGYRPVVKFEPIEKWRKKHPIPGLAEKE